MEEFATDKELSPKRQVLFLIFSCLFMLIPVLMSLQNYYNKNILGMKKAVEIYPCLESTILAILLYSSLIVREIVKIDLKTEKCFILTLKIFLTCLNIEFIASFFKLFIKNEQLKFAFIVPMGISTSAILLLGIILSWIGIKSLAGYIWIILFLLAMPRVTEVSRAMKYFGSIYVLSAFLSILFQFLPNNKFSDLVQVFKSDFKVAKKEINEDLHEAKEATEKIVETTSSITAKANGIPLPKSKK